MDVAGPSKNGWAIITYSFHDRKTQQWFFNSDGTINSEVDGLVLGVKDGQLSPEATLIAWWSNVGGNQNIQNCSFETMN